MKAVLLEIDASAPELSAEHYAALRVKHPGMPVLACSCLTPDSCGKLLAAAARGVTGFYFAEFEDVIEAANAAQASSAEEWVLRMVETEAGDRLPALLRHVLARCIRDARGRLTVPKLAASLKLSDRSITKQLRAYGTSASALVAWGRILVAARIMEHEGLTLDQAALELGLSSSSALFRMLWHRAGLRFREVTVVGGPRMLLEALVETVGHSSFHGRDRDQP